jgi:hypothetical protein
MYFIVFKNILMPQGAKSMRKKAERLAVHHLLISTRLRAEPSAHASHSSTSDTIPSGPTPAPHTPLVAARTRSIGRGSGGW